MIKKSFKTSVMENTSPATAFISESVDNNESIYNKNEKEDEKKSEKKTERVNLLFKPSTKSNIEKLAYLNHSSVNAFINDILDQYVENHQSDVLRYDSIFTEMSQNSANKN